MNTISELTLTEKQEREAKAIATMMQVKLQSRLLKDVAESIDLAGKATEDVAYACGLVLLFPELDLEVNNYWSYLHSREVKILYRVQGEGLEPIRNLMRKLRLDGWGRPELSKDKMALRWTYRKGYCLLMLVIEPGKDARCERVVTGTREVPEKVITAHQEDVYQIHCEGAEDYASVLQQNSEELKDWEASVTDERTLGTNDE